MDNMIALAVGRPETIGQPRYFGVSFKTSAVLVGTGCYSYVRGSNQEPCHEHKALDGGSSSQ